MSEDSYDLIVGPGGPGEVDSVALSVHPDLRDEVLARLRAAEIEHEPVAQHSAVLVSVILLYGFFQANAVGQLAQILDVIVHRNDGKSISTKIGDVELSGTGFSAAKAQEIIEEQLPKLLEQNIAMKAAFDESIRQDATADGEIAVDEND